MNESELRSIWQSQDKKIEKILQINKKQLFAIQSEKAESKIRSFKRSHTIVMVLGIVWVLFLGFLLYHAHDNIYFTVSVALILLFNVFAVVLYLRHIIILNQINIAESITDHSNNFCACIIFTIPIPVMADVPFSTASPSRI